MDKDLKMVLLLAVLAPVLAAPVGVPIMGYCALQQIRHSAGRIYGLGLAMFSLLFFPLLILDGLIVAVFVFGVLLIWRSAHISPYYHSWIDFLWVAVVLSFVVAGLVDYAIIKAAWRSAKRMPNDPATPAAGSHPSFFSSRAWKAACLIMAVSFVLGVIALLNQMQPLGVRRASPVITPAVSVRPAEGVRLADLRRSPVFGPVTELSLTKDAMLDLDSGRLVDEFSKYGGRGAGISLPELEKEGIDVIYDTSDVLIGVQLRLVTLAEGDWAGMTAADLTRRFTSTVTTSLSEMEISVSADGSTFYGFRTHEGGTGILQITGLQGNSRGLKIRYKLVQLVPAGALTPPDQAEADALRVKLRQAEADLARMQKLYAAKIVSQDDYEAIKSDRDVLAAEVAGNKAEIARLQIERADQKFAQAQELYQRKIIGQQEFEDARAARDVLLAQAGVPADVVDEYNALRAALVNGRSKLVSATLNYPPGSVFIKEVTNNIAELSQRKHELENNYPSLARLSSPSPEYSAELARKADRVLEAQQTRSNLMARFNAAMGITDFTAKDRALGALARDAGRAGDGDTLQKSLRQITDFTVRDSAASEAVGLLIKAGVTAPALDAAKLITDFTIRDRTLATLATEAAAAGDAKAVKDMLRIITDFTVRDQAAVESARALAKAGLLAQAMEVAKTITDFTRRDQILSELAK